MNRKAERRLGFLVWMLCVCLALAAAAIVVDASQLKRTGRLPVQLSAAPRAEKVDPLPPEARNAERLAAARMSRKVDAPVQQMAPAAKVAGPLDSLIKLTGIMDFEGRKPAVAIIETLATRETKEYRAGEAVGDTGIVIKAIARSVTVEYQSRVYRVSFGTVEAIGP